MSLPLGPEPPESFVHGGRVLLRFLGGTGDEDSRPRPEVLGLYE